MFVQVQPSQGKSKFWVPGSNLALTAAGDVVAVEAGASKDFLVHRISILQPGLQTAAGIVKLQLLRTTTPGTGGVVTPPPFDPDDVAFSGICRAAPGTPGTGGVVLAEIPVFVPVALAVGTPIIIDLQDLLGKWPRVKLGVNNGIALRHPGAAGAANFYGALEISE